MSTMFFPQAKPLGKDPTLPGAASGQDSEYTAAEAQLRANVSRTYADILQQLGHTNAQGQFIPGEVETQAQLQRTGLERDKFLAEQDVTQGSQREGTLFSGYRGQETARRQHPFVKAMADLDVSVPKELNRLYEESGRTLQDYTIQNNLLLADAASRASAKAQAAAMAQQSSGGGDWGGGDPGGGDGPNDVPQQIPATTMGWTADQSASYFNADRPWETGPAPTKPFVFDFSKVKQW